MNMYGLDNQSLEEEMAEKLSEIAKQLTQASLILDYCGLDKPTKHVIQARDQLLEISKKMTNEPIKGGHIKCLE